MVRSSRYTRRESHRERMQRPVPRWPAARRPRPSSPRTQTRRRGDWRSRARSRSAAPSCTSRGAPSSVSCADRPGAVSGCRAIRSRWRTPCGPSDCRTSGHQTGEEGDDEGDDGDDPPMTDHGDDEHQCGEGRSGCDDQHSHVAACRRVRRRAGSHDRRSCQSASDVMFELGWLRRAEVGPA